MLSMMRLSQIYLMLTKKRVSNLHALKIGVKFVYSVFFMIGYVYIRNLHDVVVWQHLKTMVTIAIKQKIVIQH